ncbi:hypothetical protein R1sor_025394 [Riccia sorocarpa]|uniref:ABC-2 type transporter transmembrane domain-containing protein n=1 Tax=Riccia sorocarpa TaxID=122646 RepID=A0ABD3GC57_9MARC
MNQWPRGMILPFQPLSISFSNVNYYVDMPPEMKQQVAQADKLQLLKSISGAFRPGVLTALVGVSQKFRRPLPEFQVMSSRMIFILLYSLYSSLWHFSASLRLSHSVDEVTQTRFVQDVMDLVELTSLRNALVGLPGTLDRTVVCTIHQPNIDIFEAFDELLLLKRGGRTIFAGPLRRGSHKLAEYSEGISGTPRIKEGYNPATWISTLCQRNKRLVDEMSQPAPNARDLWFPTKYSQPLFSQVLSCLWKQRITYWRNPKFNNMRFLFTTTCAVFLGTVFWGVGSKSRTESHIRTIIGCIYCNCSLIFFGLNNTRQIQPMVSTERTVFYRERGAGMYSAVAYGIGQVLIEIPYSLVQAVIYGSIVYFMLQLELDAGKFFWYMYFLFFTVLFFTYYGMVAVGITPNQLLAAIVASLLYVFLILFSGFLVPYSVSTYLPSFCSMAFIYRREHLTELGFMSRSY